MHVVAHDRLRQHRNRVARLHQLQRREDRSAFDHVGRRGHAGAGELVLEQYARRAGDGLQHPGPIDHVSQVKLAAARQRMAVARDRPQWLVRQRHEVEFVVLERSGKAPNRKFNLMAFEQDADLVAGLAKNAYIESRPLALDVGHRARDEIGGSAHDCAKYQVTVPTAALDLEPFHEPVQARLRLPRICHDLGTQRRRPHAARVPLEECKVERLLDVGEHLGGRRLRDVDARRSLVQRRHFSQRAEQGPVPQSQAVDQPVGRRHGWSPICERYRAIPIWNMSLRSFDWNDIAQRSIVLSFQQQ